MNMDAKKTKTSGIIGLAVMLLAAVLLIVFSNGIQATLSEISFLTPAESQTEQPPSGGGEPDVPKFEITYGSYTPGSYSAKYEGFESDVKVTLEVSETEILSLSIDASGESTIGMDAANTIKDLILSTQSAEVDAVTGATWTSDAAIISVKTALEEASKK